jgi:hypothetical protein
MENIINTQLETNIGQVIYVGAGNVPNMEWLRSLSFEQLQLIEPVESIAKKLTKKYACNNIIVKNLAISDTTGISNFSLMHPAKYSSLKQKINLSKVLKNSRIQEVKSINTLSLSELVQSTNLDAKKNNILLLSINGSELDCLNSVTQKELTQFSTIGVQVESKGIYSNTVDDSEINSEKNGVADGGYSADNLVNVKSVLKEKGFYVDDIKTDGPIFTSLVVRRDDVVLSQIAALEKEAKELKTNNQKLSEVNSEQLAKTEQDKKQQQEATAKIQAECAALKASREEQLAKTEADKKQQQDAAAKIQAECVALKASHDEQLAKTEADKKQQQDAVAKIQAEYVALKSSHDEQLSKTEADKKQQQDAAAKIQAECVALKASHDEQLAKTEEDQKQQQDAAAKIQAECVALKASRDEQLAKTEGDKKQQQDAAAKIQAECIALKALIGENEAKDVEINAYLISLKEELSEQTEWHHKNKQWAESLNSQVSLLKDDLNAKNRNVDLGQKMLAKYHIDLDHLRESYSEKLASETALVELVKDLREKLTLASKYYYQLQQEHPELLSPKETIIPEQVSHENGGR